MWVNIKTQRHFDRRMAIAVIPLRSLPEGIEWTRVLDDDEFSEEVFRALLIHRYKNVGQWVLHQVLFNAETQAFQVVVSSPDFEPVGPEFMLPVMQPIRGAT